MTTMSAPARKLRSAEWFGTADKNGFMYRSWMKNQGIPDHEFQGKPIIGICNTWSELTPCNAHFRQLAERVRRGVFEAGGYPVEFPVFSNGESNLRPTAMFTRNLASMDVEEAIRGNPIDAVVLMVGCDKTTPALLMGAASVDVPAIAVSGGPMLNGKHGGKDIGSGTAVWQLSEQVKAGTITLHEFLSAESGMSRSAGTCNTMGTASTMACMAEALGVSLPHNAAIPAVDAHAGHVRQHVAPRIDRGNGRVVRQGDAERLGHAGHRRRGPHRVAGARRARHARLGREEFTQLQRAGLHLLGQLPDCRARADVLALVLAVQHRSATDDDRRHVDAGGAHQQRGRRLVATHEQDDPVDRVAADRLLHIHAREVAGEHRGGAEVGLAVGEDGELHREAAGLQHAAFHVLGELAEVGVAGRQLRPRVADADDGLALEFVIRDALVLHPAAVHEAVLVGGAEPGSRAQGWKGFRHESIKV